MKKKIAILGGTNFQRNLILKANSLEIETHVFAWKEGNVVEDISAFFYDISTTEKEIILAKCKEIGIDGITSVGSDVAVETINYVAKKLNLIGNSIQSGINTRDKYVMRGIFKKFQLPTVNYQLIQNYEAIENLSLEYPFMIKASDRSGSRGITFVNNKNEAKIALNEALNVSYNKKVIAEEYFEGIQYSVETISQNGKHYFVGLTREFYTGIPYFVEKGHIVPGQIEEFKFNEMLTIVFAALNGLEIKNGAAHSEIRINEKGEFCLIEIASRMGGDFRAEMVEKAYNYDYLKNTIFVAMGFEIEKPINKPIGFSYVKWLLNTNDLTIYKEILQKNLILKKTEILPNAIKKMITSSEDRIGFVLAYSEDYPEKYID
jgi:biotin carboxylase